MQRDAAGAPDEPSGWALFWPTVRELWHDIRHERPATIRYLRCDGCGQITRHSTDRRNITLTSDGMVATPPEAVCDECGHVQPRTLGDEIAPDTTVACVGRRYRRWRSGRSRRPCGHLFDAPGAAPVVICPWCLTAQPPRR